MNILRKLRWTALGLTVVLSSLAVVSLPSLAKVKYIPPSDLKRPGGRQGAATRTDCAMNNTTFAPIIPNSNYGQTAEAYPTIYWYLKNHQFSWARFELYATQNQQPEAFPLYSTTFRLQSSNPLASLTLPANSGLSPLTPGTDYLWKVTLICSKQGPDDETSDGSQLSAQGWITRVAASPNLPPNPAQRTYETYAESGLWYDAVHDLALRKQQGANPQLESDWTELLQTAGLTTP